MERIDAATRSVQMPVSRYPRCSPIPTPSSRWSVANVTSIGVGASPRRPGHRRRRSDAPAPGPRTASAPGPSACTRAAAEPTTMAAAVSAAEAPSATASRATSGSIARALKQQRLPAQDQPRPAGREPPQDLVGLLAQDVRVVEGAPELEEGEVERDRDRDQQRGGHGVHGVGVCAPIHPAATRADWRRPRPRSAR